MEKILVLDFGGQYDQLIARRVRAEHVFAEIVPYNKISCREILDSGYSGIIFTGGPNSVYADRAPRFDPAVLVDDDGRVYAYWGYATGISSRRIWRAGL